MTELTATINREQLHTAFITAWRLARPWYDVADTKLAWELCRALGLEE